MTKTNYIWMTTAAAEGKNEKAKNGWALTKFMRVHAARWVNDYSDVTCTRGHSDRTIIIDFCQ